MKNKKENIETLPLSTKFLQLKERINRYSQLKGDNELNIDVKITSCWDEAVLAQMLQLSIMVGDVSYFDMFKYYPNSDLYNFMDGEFYDEFMDWLLRFYIGHIIDVFIKPCE